MHTICLMDDDGPASVGMKRLLSVLSERNDVLAVIPDSQRSGSGKALSLGHPIRILEHSKTEDYELIIHDGFPADSVPIALSMRANFDLFVSGINPGANLGYHRMLTSGTIGAALEAALQGYPALAVSQDVESKYWFTQNGVEGGLDLICSYTLRIIERIFTEGFPEGIDVLNLNFPKRVTEDSRLVITESTIAAVPNRIEAREDPYGGTYYWIQGGETDLGDTADIIEVTERNNITISPIVIRGLTREATQSLKQFLDQS